MRYFVNKYVSAMSAYLRIADLRLDLSVNAYKRTDSTVNSFGISFNFGSVDTFFTLILQIGKFDLWFAAERMVLENDRRICRVFNTKIVDKNRPVDKNALVLYNCKTRNRGKFPAIVELIGDRSDLKLRAFRKPTESELEGMSLDDPYFREYTVRRVRVSDFTKYVDC